MQVWAIPGINYSTLDLQKDLLLIFCCKIFAWFGSILLFENLELPLPGLLSWPILASNLT